MEVRRHAKDFNCAKCPRNHHCDTTGEWPGSRGPAGYDLHEIPGVIVSRVCLLPMITNETTALITLHTHYKNRLLPFDGGLLNQPHYYLQAMELLEYA